MGNDVSISIRDLLYIFFYRFPLFVIVFVATIAAIIIFTVIQDPLYETKAKILVETRALSSDVSITQEYQPPQSIGEILNTEIQLILSVPVLSRALDRVKGEGMQDSREKSILQKVLSPLVGLLQEESRRDPKLAAIEELRKHIRIAPISESNIIEIALQGDNPRRIKHLLDSITEEYISYHLEVYRSLWSEEFFKEQMVITRSRLAALEDSLKCFQERESPLINEDYDRLVSEEVSNIQGDLLNLKEEISLQRARVEQMGELLQSDPEQALLLFSDDITVSDLTEMRFEAELEKDALLLKYTPEYRAIQELEFTIETIDRKIEEKAQDLYELEMTQYDLMGKEYLALEEILHGIEAKVQDCSAKKLHIDKLEREIEDNRQIYSNLLLKGENARISAQADNRVAALKVIDPATIQDVPVSPRVMTNLLVSPFAAILLGMGIVFIFELMDNSLKTPHEVEKKLGVKVLASIPRSGKQKRRKKRNPS
jgi:uncharacterized protein involved in exopolysaccharide biosynthesis